MKKEYLSREEVVKALNEDDTVYHWYGLGHVAKEARILGFSFGPNKKEDQLTIEKTMSQERKEVFRKHVYNCVDAINRVAKAKQKKRDAGETQKRSSVVEKIKSAVKDLSVIACDLDKLAADMRAHLNEEQVEKGCEEIEQPEVQVTVNTWWDGPIDYFCTVNSQKRWGDNIEISNFIKNYDEISPGDLVNAESTFSGKSAELLVLYFNQDGSMMVRNQETYIGYRVSRYGYLVMEGENYIITSHRPRC